MSVKIDRTALRRVKHKVKRVGERADNPITVWPRVGSYLSNVTYRQFVTRGAYHGTPWQPLKPWYAQWKLRAGYGRTMLVLTGRLKASWVSRPMSIERYTRHKGTFGSDNPLVVFHQYGTRRGLPARKMLVVTPKMVNDISDIFAEYVTTGRIGTVKHRIL